MVYQGIRFKIRATKSKHPWRCDVWLKCIWCGWVADFGVMITKEQYNLGAQELGDNKKRMWRDAKRLLEAHDDNYS